MTAPRSDKDKTLDNIERAMWWALKDAAEHQPMGPLVDPDDQMIDASGAGISLRPAAAAAFDIMVNNSVIELAANCSLEPATDAQDALFRALSTVMAISVDDAPKTALSPEHDILHQITKRTLEELHVADWELRRISADG